MFQLSRPAPVCPAQPHMPCLEPAICSGFNEEKEGPDGTAAWWEAREGKESEDRMAMRVRPKSLSYCRAGP